MDNTTEIEVDTTNAPEMTATPEQARDVQAAMTDALRATAMLADVTIGTWSGERSDPAAMSTLAASAGAKGKVGRVVKNLMAGADARLKDARSAFTAVRTAHVMLTQPWVSDLNADRVSGPRLLPNMLFQRYLETITARRNAAMAALDIMLEHYDADVATAKAQLGGLADADYPTAEQVRGLFYAKVDFEPLPEASGFRNLPEAFATKLAASLRKKQAAMMEGAQAHLWQVARERLERMYDRMSQPEAMFKSSTVEQLRSLVDLMPAWDVLGDPRVTTVVDGVRSALDGVDSERIRKDDNLRARLAREAKALIDHLDEWGLGRASA